MADVDVLCLQEVARNFPCLPGSAGENQYETLAGLFPDYTLVKGVAIDVLAPQGDWREFGNALITRLPILQVYRRLLPWPSDPTVPSMQRSAIEVLEAPSACCASPDAPRVLLDEAARRASGGAAETSGRGGRARRRAPAGKGGRALPAASAPGVGDPDRGLQLQARGPDARSIAGFAGCGRSRLP
jgi:hypothetical protein